MKLNILYTINQKYIDIMLASIMSLYFNNSHNELSFHIITEGFSSSDYAHVESILKQIPNVDIHFYSLDNYDIEKYDIPSWRGSQIGNARLFFQDIIKLDDIKNLLYLDADTIVVNDLAGILSYESAINATYDSISIPELKERNLTEYFNSGVLFFNIDKWLNGDYLRTIIDYNQNNQKALVYPDQDLLNYALASKINKMPFRYNMGPYAMATKFNYNKHFYDGRSRLLDFSAIKEDIEDPVILHSYGAYSSKPWMDNKVNPFNEDFEYYMNFVNQEFTKEKLTGLKRLIYRNRNLYYFLLLSRGLLAQNRNKLTKHVRELKNNSSNV